MVQDAFVGLYHRWRQLRDQRGDRLSEPGGRQRRSRSAPPWASGHVSPAAAGAGAEVLPSAEQEAVQHEEADRLWQAIAALPYRQRQVIVLRYYLDQSEAEIAETFEVSRGSARSTPAAAWPRSDAVWRPDHEHIRLERRLGEVLQQHAEDAMNHTDTDQLETLERDLPRDRPRTRTRWVAAAAAAAAVIAALVVVEVRGDDRSDTPAGLVDDGAATALASDFVDAVAAYDAERATSYLADDASIQLRTSTVDAQSMGPHMRWTRAAGFRLLPGRCELESVSAPAATVACAYARRGSVRNGWAGVRSRTTSSG